MNKILQTFLCPMFFVAKAENIKGHVYDQKNGEPIIGATVMFEQTNKATLTGLDGFFELMAAW